MSLSWNDISLSVNETSLGGMNTSLDVNETSLGGRNTSLDVNDISRRRKRYIVELKRYVSFGSKDISLKENDHSLGAKR